MQSSVKALSSHVPGCDYQRLHCSALWDMYFSDVSRSLSAAEKQQNSSFLS